ncbi:MAG: ABC transporter permease [Proteobacteria bacterium]|nr:ABC transporter permease [Pseudomonadota bacterium]
MTEVHILSRQLHRSNRPRHLASFALVLPLFAFLVFSYGFPIGTMLWQAVSDKEVGIALPNTVAALASWDGKTLPDEKVFRALAADIKKARADETLAPAARRLNYDVSGFREVLFRTARRPPPANTASVKDYIIGIDSAWSNPNYWGAIRNAAGPASLYYLLSAIDLRTNPVGSIIAKPNDSSIFIDIFVRTFEMSLIVTLICVALGFPVAYLLTSLPARLAYPLLVLVLVPFWTSLLVRTAAWVVLLQNRGIVNHALIDLHILSEPTALIYNRLGVYVAMTHILLPYFILPLYSVMKGISPNYMRAAASLGARPIRAFIKVYLPQCASGITAGCLLVFTVAIGFYITPALVGGAADQMISYYIAFYTNTAANWGLACALSVWLLLATFVLYFLYGRLVGGVAGPVT